MSAVDKTHVPRELAYPRQLPSAVAVVFFPHECYNAMILGQANCACFPFVRSFFVAKERMGFFCAARA